MSHLIEHLRQLVRSEDWAAVLEHEAVAITIADPVDRARALYMLSHARWRRGQDAFDYARAVQLAQQVTTLDDLQGRALHWLGTCLVTIGRYREGRRVLQRWLARYQHWAPAVQAGIGDVQYALGYAARYERDMPEAELWYRAAYETHRRSGNTADADTVGCGLVKVLVRQGQVSAARQVMEEITSPGSEAYRLVALAELLAAEGDLAAAAETGERASALLVELDDADPWELAELHLSLSSLQYQAGNYAERDRHLALAMDAMALSPRHDLHSAACLLLDSYGWGEVNTG